MLDTAQDVLDLVRSQLDDTSEPYLWPDAELIEYLDRAQREFAQKTLCFPDYTNFSLSTLHSSYAAAAGNASGDTTLSVKTTITARAPCTERAMA